MKKLLSLILAVSCTVMLMTACQSEPTSEQESSSQSQPKDYAYQLDPESVRVYDVAVPGRGIEIPGTLTLPAGTDTDRVPLVIFEHDLFGDRSTNGVFEEIALGLADQGIASIAIDFSGCGDSTEDFADNCPFFIDWDVIAARDFAIENSPIDDTRLGLLGYGFGARMAMDAGALKDSPYTAMSLISPMVGDYEDTLHLLFGSEYNRMISEAFSEARGTEFTAADGITRTISVNWFDDMTLSDPMSKVQNLKGHLQVISATQDELVPGEVTQALLDGAADTQAEVTSLEVESDHSFGFPQADSAVRAQVIDAVVTFFAGAF